VYVYVPLGIVVVSVAIEGRERFLSFVVAVAVVDCCDIGVVCGCGGCFGVVRALLVVVLVVVVVVFVVLFVVGVVAVVVFLCSTTC